MALGEHLYPLFNRHIERMIVMGTLQDLASLMQLAKQFCLEKDSNTQFFSWDLQDT